MPELTIRPVETTADHELSVAIHNDVLPTRAVTPGEALASVPRHLGAGRPEVAFHDLTGVKRAWRGRGIARALKATQIGWAKEHGYARLETMNEERNEPIGRLNAEFGYRPEPGWITLVGPLSDGT